MDAIRVLHVATLSADNVMKIAGGMEVCQGPIVQDFDFDRQYDFKGLYCSAKDEHCFDLRTLLSICTGIVSALPYVSDNEVYAEFRISEFEQLVKEAGILDNEPDLVKRSLLFATLDVHCNMYMQSPYNSDIIQATLPINTFTYAQYPEEQVPWTNTERFQMVSYIEDGQLYMSICVCPEGEPIIRDQGSRTKEISISTAVTLYYSDSEETSYLKLLLEEYKKHNTEFFSACIAENKSRLETALTYMRVR
jgi:hypothetical protein